MKQGIAKDVTKYCTKQLLANLPSVNSKHPHEKKHKLAISYHSGFTVYTGHFAPQPFCPLVTFGCFSPLLTRPSVWNSEVNGIYLWQNINTVCTYRKHVTMYGRKKTATEQSIFS